MMLRDDLPLKDDPHLLMSHVKARFPLQKREPHPGSKVMERQSRSKVSLFLWLGTALAALHLLLTILGASMVRLPFENGMTRFIELYGLLTGSGHGFNYFAPEIGTELRARFEITDSAGLRREDTLARGANREMQLRLNSALGEFGRAVPDQGFRQKVAAVWAAKMFTRHPNAKNISVILEELQLPSLSEYRKVNQVGWRLVYQADFSRKFKNEKSSRISEVIWGDLG